MARTADYSDQVCAIAAALEVVGDPWTLLIVRDTLRGKRRFEALQGSLGCARNVLTARLKTLVEQGMLERRAYSERPPRFEYVPTAMARDLFPVLMTLSAWGERHIYGHGHNPVRMIHRCGADLDPTLTCGACGEAATARDIRLELAEEAPTAGQALARLREEAA
jgi:DNA-binding HxlR family transcriptional regulator